MPLKHVFIKSHSKLPIYSLYFKTSTNTKSPPCLRRNRVAGSETLCGLIAVQIPLFFTLLSNSRPASYPFIKALEVAFDLFSPSAMHLIRPMWKRDALSGGWGGRGVGKKTIHRDGTEVKTSPSNAGGAGRSLVRELRSACLEAKKRKKHKTEAIL